jgi:hypothetical protein
MTTSLEFTETMRGFLFPNSEKIQFPCNQLEYEKAFQSGHNKNTKLEFTLTIRIKDIDSFCLDPKLTAAAIGQIDCPLLGGILPVQNGRRI